MRLWFLLGVTISIAFSVSGCSSIASGVTGAALDKMLEPDPTSVAARFVATDFINPDPQNRPSPLIVRFYELSSVGKFNEAGFFKLYEKDEDTLGKDLLERDEFQFVPGETRTFERELNPETRYVAVMAAYRNIDQATWRASFEVVLNEKSLLEVKLDKLAVGIEVKQECAFYDFTC